MSTDPRLRAAALQLALIQFFFVTTWVVYVTFLGELLERVGLGRDFLVGFILLDQAVFAVTDIAMGYAADRVERALGRLGPFIVSVNLVSCGAFLSLPFATDLPDAVAIPVFTALIVLWIATSSVLRAPPIVLLMKHAARPQAPALAALSMLGLALAGAVAPYLGQLLKGASPYLPFVLASGALAAATLGLVRVQRIVAELPPAARDPGTAKPAAASSLMLLFGGALALGFGFQLHQFLNTKPQYLQFIEPVDLVWVLPVFWIGFKLFALAATAATKRYGAPLTMAAAALVGAVALFGCWSADSLPALLAAQLIAGGSWGVLFTAGIAAALNLGSNGDEGLVLGAFFTVLSVGAVARLLLVSGGVTREPGLSAALQWAPVPLWVAGGGLLLALGWSLRRSRAA